jgi:hypothetical protein
MAARARGGNGRQNLRRRNNCRPTARPAATRRSGSLWQRFALPDAEPRCRAVTEAANNESPERMNLRWSKRSGPQ